jgi:hypothetical protein
MARERKKVPVAADEQIDVIYAEVPAAMKAAMVALSRKHNRKLVGEVKQALEEYLRKHKAWPPPNADED